MKGEAHLKLATPPAVPAPDEQCDDHAPGRFAAAPALFRVLNPTANGSGCSADQTSLWSYGVIVPPDGAVTVWVELTNAPGTQVGVVGAVVRAPFPPGLPAEVAASGANWACRVTGLPVGPPLTYFARDGAPAAVTVAVPLNCTRVQ